MSLAGSCDVIVIGGGRQDSGSRRRGEGWPQTLLVESARFWGERPR